MNAGDIQNVQELQLLPRQLNDQSLVTQFIQKNCVISPNSPLFFSIPLKHIMII